MLENLNRQLEKGYLRQLKVSTDLIDFASNDYLGLARSSYLALMTEKEFKNCEEPLNGLCSTGSRLLTGNSCFAQNLEERISQFHGFNAALLFGCGYLANVGLLSSVLQRDDLIIFDRKVHASMHDGIALGKAKSMSFRHNDLNDLEKKLQRTIYKGKCYICVESIYSTDGSKAPLVELCQLAHHYKVHLIVDEAHAIGIWGPQGKGLVADMNLQDHVFALVVTFGKALGAYGAAVLGNQILKQYLINFARSFIYTTALPFHLLASISGSYSTFPYQEFERYHLKRLIEMFHQAGMTDSTTQIQSVQIPGVKAVLEIARKLEQFGFDVRPLISPTVKQGKEVLRICLHAFNTLEQVSELIEHLKRTL